MSFWKKLGNAVGYVAAPFTGGASLALTDRGQKLISDTWDKYTGVAQTRETNEANAAEAQKNRDWQEMMANTAHQREKQDLMMAGLNPAAAAQTGAQTGPGAQATMQSAPSGADTMSKVGNTISAVSGGINSIAAAAKTFSENKYIDDKTKAEISNIAADTTVKGAQATETQASTQNLQADTEKKKVETEQIMQQIRNLTVDQKIKLTEYAIAYQNAKSEIERGKVEEAFNKSAVGWGLNMLGNGLGAIIPWLKATKKGSSMTINNY